MESHGQTEHTIIKYYNKGFSPKLVRYLDNTLKAALDKSVDSYGTYELKPYSNKLSASRAKLVTQKGRDLHILFSTHWHGPFIDNKQVKKIDLSIFNGMLGLRGLIALPKTQDRLKKIVRTNEIRQYTAGLGEKWGDVEILQKNHIPVIEVASYQDGLFSMLAKKRYDYLPLSMLEVHDELARRKQKFKELEINDTIYIFYPIPIDLYVHKGEIQLHERLVKGYEIAIKDGTIDKLFRQHFDYVFEELGNKDNKIIMLTNPSYSQAENMLYIQKFEEKYGEKFKVLP